MAIGSSMTQEDLRRYVLGRILPDAETLCWVWQAALHHNGYGAAQINGYGRAHRLAYEVFVGPIPEGLQLDHLCRNRACVNPGHLEPVTAKENIQRGMPFRSGERRRGERARSLTCRRGHLRSEHTVVDGHSGALRCGECRRDEARARRALAAQTVGAPS